jgi:RimJ/RimL family protein N-acetyltransferase
MESTLRALLRLHIEAAWGIHLPLLTLNTVELLREGMQPSWKLYAAEMAGEQVAIWRPDVAAPEREALFERAREVLAVPPTEPITPHIGIDVVLHQVASPTMSMAAAQRIARLLTPDDQVVVERFDPGEVEYYFHPDRRPLIGVIVAGRVLSLAHSSRRTAQACELGIDTLPEARRKGYALAATLLWAASVAQEDLVPFYSTSAENTASLGLAAAAGYRVFARAVVIEEEEANH